MATNSVNNGKGKSSEKTAQNPSSPSTNISSKTKGSSPTQSAKLKSITKSKDAFVENKEIASVDDAKLVITLRVAFLNTLQVDGELTLAVTTQSRDVVWKINVCFDDWKQWRNEISKSLCSEQFPAVAIRLASRCLEELSSRHEANEGIYKIARNLTSTLINFSRISSQFRENALTAFDSKVIVAFLAKTAHDTNSSGNQLLRINCLRLLLIVYSSFPRSALEEGIDLFSQYTEDKYIEECRCLAAICLTRALQANVEQAAYEDTKGRLAFLYQRLDAIDKGDYELVAWIVRALEIFSDNPANKEKITQLVNEDKKMLQRIMEQSCRFEISCLTTVKNLLRLVNPVDPGVEFQAIDKLTSEQEIRSEIAARISFLAKLSDLSPESMICYDSAHVLWTINTYKNTLQSSNRSDAITWLYEVIAEENFLAIAFKYLNKLLKRDPEQEPLSYSMTKSICGVIWDGTDQFEKIRIKTANAGVVDLFLDALKDRKSFDRNIAESEKMESILLVNALAILYNSSRSSQTKHKFAAQNAANVLVLYLDTKRVIMVSLNIAYVVSDTPEAARLADERGIIKSITELCTDAMKYDDRLSRLNGNMFWLSELLDGLCILATNDENKKKLMDNGVIDLLRALLLEGKNDEKIRGLDLLWTLCFESTVRETITTKHNDDIMALLQELATQSDVQEDVQKAAKKTFDFIQKWQDLQESKPNEAISSMKSSGHVFISYSWKQQDIALQMRGELLSRNYKVWMDVDKMHGGLLDAMAKAVEDAAVVLLCYSQSYKESNPCRAEAQYAYSLGKPIIPVNMEYHYKPDGWLGIIVLPLLYIDMSLKKKTFEESVVRLLNEIENLIASSTKESHQAIANGSDHQQAGETGRTHGSIVETTTKNRRQSIVSSEAPKRGPKSTAKFAKWSTSDVINWAKKEKLPKTIEAKMDRFDGRKLWTLLNARAECPEFFYQGLKDYFGNNLPDMLQLLDALNRLLESDNL